MIKVIHHYPCFDGIGAKYAAWKKFGNTAQYIGHNYGETKDLGLNLEDEIYILDFSFKRDRMLEIAGQVKTLTIIDHHKTAQADIEGLAAPNLIKVFDMKQSGAVLSWKFFHPDEPVPTLLLYVEDRDLWNWTMPNSERVNEGLTAVPLNVHAWEDLVKDWPASVEMLLARGDALLDRKKRVVTSAIKDPMWITLNGVTMPIVNTTEYMSDVGNALVVSGHPCSAYFMVRGGKVQVGLRSTKEGTNVSEICAAYGGGGHHAAAGFVTTPEAFFPLLRTTK